VAKVTSAVSAVSAAALAIIELTAATSKCTAAGDGGTNDDDVATNSEWGRNCDNSAVAGLQERVPKKPKNRLIGHSTLPAFHKA
jgi:hypothetical protein